jgi:hypothetical protein
MSNSSTFDLASVYDLLTGFAHLDNFWGLFETAFGTQYDRSVAEGLRSRRYCWKSMGIIWMFY